MSYSTRTYGIIFLRYLCPYVPLQSRSTVSKTRFLLVSRVSFGDVKDYEWTRKVIVRRRVLEKIARGTVRKSNFCMVGRGNIKYLVREV